jgi:hypothetical protein
MNHVMYQNDVISMRLIFTTEDPMHSNRQFPLFAMLQELPDNLLWLEMKYYAQQVEALYDDGAI